MNTPETKRSLRNLAVLGGLAAFAAFALPLWVLAGPAPTTGSVSLHGDREPGALPQRTKGESTAVSDTGGQTVWQGRARRDVARLYRAHVRAELQTGWSGEEPENVARKRREIAIALRGLSRKLAQGVAAVQNSEPPAPARPSLTPEQARAQAFSKAQGEMSESFQRTWARLGDPQGKKGVAFRGLQRQKGKLHLPLIFGKVKHGFGSVSARTTKLHVRHTGWTITAPRGHRVRNIAKGEVVFAGHRRGYGLLVVIDHGEGYHSVYAHLKKITTRVGATLPRGAPLGVLGSTGSLHGEKLYFELRQDGQSLDPKGWFAPASTLR